MNAALPVRAGMPAPRFTLATVDGVRLASDAARGRPWVLAFVRDWTPDDLEPIRAELRGLGAILFVVSRAGVWGFHPDDAIELVATADGPHARAIGAMARDYAVQGGDAVFIIDANGMIRLAHRPDAPIGAAFADALAIAGRELVARRLGLWSAITRRDVLLGSLYTGFAIALLPGCKRRQVEETPGREAHDPPEATVDVALDINGTTHRMKLEPRTSLLDVLRERLALTGTKKGCDHGQCGACTVLVDNRRVLACLTLAVAADRRKITTIEGLAKGDDLHPMQEAFVAHDGLQCGYCTPGQIMSAVGLQAEGIPDADDAIREQMCGNLCRCGAYNNIVAAIRAVRRGA
jgi:xanthine dehydrogenase YagT iron-sulfur-binding subunit